LRSHTPEDFETLHSIDQACFPRGIAYSRRMLRWFLTQRGADCLVAQDGAQLVGFVLTHTSGHAGQIITLDVLAGARRRGIGSRLLREAESRMAAAGVHHVILETATNNEAAVAFWQQHGYRTQAVLKNYYLNTLDAFQMRKSLHANPATRAEKP
jgi:ribosomal-protein-alanine N-acetyltransferase